MRIFASLLPSLLIGVFSFLWLFGWQRAVGTGGPFESPGGDLAQHIAGAYAYLDGGWDWPIFKTDRINYPQGVNIIFTDSAPFAGLMAKLVQAATGVRWNYLGTWFFILWVGQAVSASILLLQLNQRDWVVHAAAAIFAISFPPFLMRHGHLALSSHFLIILAFAAYFLSRSGSPTRSALVWFIILAVSVLTHAYLFFICFSIFLASVADRFVHQPREWLRLAIDTITIVLCVFFLMFAGGYFGQDAAPAAAGYNTYNADLLSSVWPAGTLFTAAPPPFSASVGFEGYNYFGLFSLLLIIFSLPTIILRLSDRLTSAPFLFITVLTLGIYSFGSVLRFAGIDVFTYPVPLDFPPYSIFRASGRMFWPLGYALLFASLACIGLWQRGMGSRYIVAVLAVAQLIDSSPLLLQVKRGSAGEEKVLAERLIESVDEVVFAPPIGCIPSVDILTLASEINWVAARAGKRTNSAHIARNAHSNCDVKIWPNDALYVVAPQFLTSDLRSIPESCLKTAGLFLCSESLEASGKDDVVSISPPECRKETNFNRSAKDMPWARGFFEPEASGMWTNGRSSILVCNNSTYRPNVRVTISGIAFSLPSKEQTITVLVNGVEQGDFSMPFNVQSAFEFTTTLPVGIVEIELRAHYPTKPSEIGMEGDHRDLALLLQNISLDAGSDDPDAFRPRARPSIDESDLKRR